MSHDPAIVALSGDFNRPEMAEAAIKAGVEGHEDCDLMIGAYSYPLVQLGCPPAVGAVFSTGGKCAHNATQWIDVDWVRLLLAVLDSDPKDRGAVMAASTIMQRCWTPQRLRRLRIQVYGAGG
jgi:hypothetical protein